MRAKSGVPPASSRTMTWPDPSSDHSLVRTGMMFNMLVSVWRVRARLTSRAMMPEGLRITRQRQVKSCEYVGHAAHRGNFSLFHEYHSIRYARDFVRVVADV